MVRLTKIYTRTGDDGTTALGDGTRVQKSSDRIEAYGTVDELNAAMGLCLDALGDGPDRERLLGVQNDLFDLGADLCVPVKPGAGADEAPGQSAGGPHIGEARVARLEAWIDEVNAALPPLESFVLPGGNPAASAFHLARTVCRRAERRVLTLAAKELVGLHGIVYLNRLSDLLFVLARQAAGGDEVLWRPTRDDPGAESGS
jgi:cob(I)alamin adenosyltransferase